MLKRLLKNRRIDLHTLLRAIEETLSRLQANYDANYHEQTSKRVKKYQHSVMKLIRFHVGFFALDLIAKRVDIAVADIAAEGDRRKEPSICMGAFERQFGLPCAHTIAQLIQDEDYITLDHIDKHWWLKHEQVSRLVMMLTIHF